MKENDVWSQLYSVFEHFSFLMVWKHKNAQNKVLKVRSESVILGRTMMKIIIDEDYRFILRNITSKTESNKTLALH